MDPVKDAALEREIERALAVDPSPEFLVRVRARIADEPAPASRGFGWLFAGVATVAAAAALGTGGADGFAGAAARNCAAPGVEVDWIRRRRARCRSRDGGSGCRTYAAARLRRRTQKAGH